MEQSEIDQRNFCALVNWHKEELLEIMNGSSAYEVFNSNKRKKLKDYGVLCRSRMSEKVRPTPEAIAVLEDQGVIPTTGDR